MRDRSRAIANQLGDFFSGAEVGLMDDAGLTLDAGAFDDVVVELIAFLLCDERRHTG